MTHLSSGQRLAATLAFAALLCTTSAAAHGGDAHASSLLSPLSAGFFHPITGWDHLLVIAMTGAFAARQPRGARLAAPFLFTAMMLAGFVIGRFAAPVGFVEVVIVLSLLGMVAMLVAPRTFARPAPALFAVFGAAHGVAHGLEAPAGGSLWFAAGMVAATAALQVAAFAGARALGLGGARGTGAPE